MNLFEVIREVRRHLEENGRISLRMLRRQYTLDEEALSEVVDELVDELRIARHEGNSLIWTGTTMTGPTPPRPQTPAPSSPAPVSYTPKHLADRILQSRSALEGERKQVTVLFADVKGSMELAEQLDPEAWHAILERFFAILTDGVHRFEGTVNQYTGDGIMALFGAPIAHEDHAQRACYAALALRDELARYALEVQRQYGVVFSTRMGINSGAVVVGRIGDDLRMDYTAQGHTVGLAQRMESMAEPNGCFVSAATAALATGYFALDDLGEFRVKGVAEPVPVFRLTGLGTARSRFDISRSRGLSRFVGRDADMQTLETALEQARAGNGQVVGIVAEAGTGKSRLCFEFLERCKAKGITTQVGRALAHGRNVPLVPMLEVFRAYFGIAEGDADRLVRDRIAGRLLQMDEHFRSLLPVLFEFFGVADPAQEPLHMDAESKQRQLFAVLRKVVQEGRADGQPVTLIEDLHWIDASSEAFLEQWVEAVAGSHSLLILNFRPEYHATWMNRSWYRQIPLAPLGPEAVRALLDDLIGQHPSTLGLAEAIHARSGGNPFFTEEIVQSLIESGALTGARGSYQLTTPVSTLQVPATVQALLAARIDRLAEREKQVLQAASVIDKDFSEPVLQRVLADLDAAARVDLPAALRILRDAEFVHEVSLYPVAEYTFKHPLTQEVALHSQLQERRRRTHAAVARALEVTRVGRLDETAALIAQHYESAADAEAAARWHRRAALWAGYKDVRAALRHWERVRELARQMGDTAEATTLLIEACSQAFIVGSWREGGTASEWQTLYEEGLRAAERAKDLRAMATLQMNYGAIRAYSHAVGPDFVRLCAEAVQIAERSGDLGLRSGTLVYLAIANFWNGSLAETERLADAVIALTRGDPHLGADVSGFSPWLSARVFRATTIGCSRDPRAALLECQSIRQFAMERGFPEMALWAANAEILLRKSIDRPEGLDALSQFIVRFAENRDVSAFLLAAMSRCAVLESASEWGQLLTVAFDALEIVRSRKVLRVYEPTFERQISTAHLKLGRLQDARDAAAEGVTCIRDSSAFWEPDCYAALVRAQLALNESAAEITALLDEYAALLARTSYAIFEGEMLELRAVLAEREGREEILRSALQAAHTAYARFGMNRHIERLEDHFGSLDGRS